MVRLGWKWSVKMGRTYGGMRSTSVFGWNATQANQYAIVAGSRRPWSSRAAAVP
jgi:hypothetical protein